MTTYRTLAEARTADKTGVEIAEILHATEGRCFVRTKFPVSVLRANLAKVPEITKILAAHALTTPEQDETTRRAMLTSNCNCTRCRVKLDGNVAYRRTETTRFQGRSVQVNAYYCEPCRELLAQLSH